MQYFYRAHHNADSVIEFAGTFFGSRGYNASGSGDTITFTDPCGVVKVSTESEGGHYVRVTAATNDVGESETDRVAKRFLAELHKNEEPGHVVRGAY